jgi:hypothetical protein
MRVATVYGRTGRELPRPARRQADLENPSHAPRGETVPAGLRRPYGRRTGRLGRSSRLHYAWASTAAGIWTMWSQSNLKFDIEF